MIFPIDEKVSRIVVMMTLSEPNLATILKERKARSTRSCRTARKHGRGSVPLRCQCWCDDGIESDVPVARVTILSHHGCAFVGERHHGDCGCRVAVRCCARTELGQAGVEGAAIAGRRQQREQLRQQREEGDQEVEDVPAVLPERAEGIDPLETCIKATRPPQLRDSGQYRNKKP